MQEEMLLNVSSGNSNDTIDDDVDDGVGDDGCIVLLPPQKAQPDGVWGDG